MSNKPPPFNDERFRPETMLPKPFSSLIDVDVFAMSDKGLVRSTNEDHYLVVRGGRAIETVFSSLSGNRAGDIFEETAYAFVVADGVGGEAGGEVASRQAIFTLLNLALRTPDWQFRWGPDQRKIVMWRMQDRFRRVNAALVQQATAHASLNGMCTTMTMALTHGKNLIVGYMGDSRAYLLHDTKLQRLTRDHTVAERMIEEGIDPANDQLLNQLRNVLMQALGGPECDCNPDTHDYSLENGDQLLLCTDGLTDMVAEEEIETVLNTSDSAQSACRSLVNLALSSGGHDNITAIVARYSIPQLQP
jgi:PPM family protein phosphatase